MLLDLKHGALATSGDSRRYLLKTAYGTVIFYIPAQDGGARLARSVTVAASSCTEAGLLSTVALLHGIGARAFLEEQGVRYWLVQ